MSKPMESTKPELPPALQRLGAHLCYHPPEEETPLPWAVWDATEDDGGSGDILGAGETAEDAIADACETVTGWDVNASLEAGR